MRAIVERELGAKGGLLFGDLRHLAPGTRGKGALALDLDRHGLRSAMGEGLLHLASIDRLPQLQLSAGEAQRLLGFSLVARRHSGPFLRSRGLLSPPLAFLAAARPRASAVRPFRPP